MTDASPDTLAPETVVAGKLRVVRALGQGGMGAVYEVEHVFTKHRRALKLLHPQFAANPAVVARFLREASAAGRIGNPHIVETFDAGQLPGGEPYLVMELLSGSALDQLLARRGRLPVAEAIEIVRQACSGVQAAHDAGIVHRDLKPENLFLLSGTQRFVKILDFGISKFDDSLVDVPALTTAGSIMGTPFYMSPEQVRGETLDARADVYALGVVLYECLSGEKPFLADNLAELGVKIHQGKHRALSELCPDIPESVARVVATAMAVDKNARWASASELGARLTALGEQLELGSSATIAVESQPPPAPPLMPGDSSSSLHPARTDAAHELDAPAARASGMPRWPLVAALGAAGVIAIGWFATRGHEPSTAAVPEPPNTPTASAPEPRQGPSVAPVLAPLPAEITPDAATTDARVEAAPRPTNPKPKPTVKPPAAAGDRGSQHQIANENPF